MYIVVLEINTTVGWRKSCFVFLLWPVPATSLATHVCLRLGFVSLRHNNTKTSASAAVVTYFNFLTFYFQGLEGNG
jgi:hypothetical protein